MKILTIGNSFSQNCTTMLQHMHKDLFVRNLCIGGCSLEMHSDNIASGAKAYGYQENGVKCFEEIISVADALHMEVWDVITVQQVSQLAGVYGSYYPYLTNVLRCIRQHCPSARIVFNQTWAYEPYSDHPEFVLYDRDSEKMYERIVSTTDSVAQENNLPVIRTGEFVQYLRRNGKFYLDDGTCILSHDGFHLSMVYGNYAAAYMWNHYFTGEKSPFVPPEADVNIIGSIQELYDAFIQGGK